MEQSVKNQDFRYFFKSGSDLVVESTNLYLPSSK